MRMEDCICPSSSNEFLLKKKKNSSSENGAALKLCKRFLGIYSSCPGQKSILYRTQRNSLCKSFRGPPCFGDFSHKTLQLETTTIYHSVCLLSGIHPVVQWLVQRFRSERLRVRSRRSATFTPSAHVRRQSLPVWPPTLNNYLYLYLYLYTKE